MGHDTPISLFASCHNQNGNLCATDVNKPLNRPRTDVQEMRIASILNGLPIG